MRRLRFRRFSVRLLLMLLGLLVAALATTYFLVSRANIESALRHSEANLEIGARVFDEAVAQRTDFLAKSASVMTGDYAIRQVLLAERPDRATLSSSLKSYTGRVQAPVIVLFDRDHELLASSAGGMADENKNPFLHLIETAEEKDRPQANDFGLLSGELHMLVVVPLYAPFPEIVGWFGLAFPIDRRFAQKIKDTTQLEVTFVGMAEGHARLLASTLPQAQASLVADYVGHHPSARAEIVSIQAERYVSRFKNQDLLGEDPIRIVLQRPLRRELAAANDLQNYLLLISLVALAGAALLALWIARGVSKPVLALAAHTRAVARGDYGRRLELSRDDELGQLATAFNEMTAGLAERDQVRDLLGKVVSPEIAAELMRSGVALGGEEREATVLFSDIRAFTALSEKLAPADLLALLNRYLDRMSGVVEKNGGVIDKYIGDAIMAIFGAPVRSADAAGRALVAAREMHAELDRLNAELAREGISPLRIGIGVNTGRLVAGNMGSRTRLNYTVIGDAVNLASRLQSLTKEPSYAARIIASEACVRTAVAPGKVRPLGEVLVKGKTEAVKIFAVE